MRRRFVTRTKGETLIQRNRRFFLYDEPSVPIGPWSGAVAVLDVLGFKTVGQRASLTEEVQFLSKYFELEQAFLETSYRLVKVKITPKGIKHSPGPRIPTTKVNAFQDTLVVTMRGLDPTRRTLDEMGSRLAKSFKDALENGLFLRGAIAVGRFYQSPATVVGPAVYEALDWHDKADWIGVMLTPSAQYAMERLRHEGRAPGWFVPYAVPLKDERIHESWALAWPRRFAREDLLEIFAESQIMLEDSAKYRNTLAFFDKVEPHHLEILKEAEEKRIARESTRIHKLTSLTMPESMAAEEDPAVVAERAKRRAERKKPAKK